MMKLSSRACRVPASWATYRLYRPQNALILHTCELKLISRACKFPTIIKRGYDNSAIFIANLFLINQKFLFHFQSLVLCDIKYPTHTRVQDSEFCKQHQQKQETEQQTAQNEHFLKICLLLSNQNQPLDFILGLKFPNIISVKNILNLFPCMPKSSVTFYLETAL
jgi:hypothetical protein